MRKYCDFAIAGHFFVQGRFLAPIKRPLRAFVRPTVRSSSSSKRDLEIEIEHCLKRHPLPSVLFQIEVKMF